MYKTIKILLMLLFAGGVVATLHAQPGGGMSPEERAEWQAKTMTDSLGLSEAQSNKVREIGLKYGKKMQEARAAAEGDWESMRGTMQAIRDEQDKELQTVMTQEQWQKWELVRANMRGNRGNSNRQGEGSGKPAGPPEDGKSKNKKKSKSKS